ncbi:MAG TPA: hypothetical protein VES02_12730 [Dermatophilaceae bacterium]|nr:hypothetical protein [Dermatophilaceae bacterium]
MEFDGKVKYGGADGRDALFREKRREDALRSLGYQVARLTWRDLQDPALVQGLITAAFSRSSSTLAGSSQEWRRIERRR